MSDRRFACALALAALGCSSPAVDTTCRSNADCSGALVCIAGACVEEPDVGAPALDAGPIDAGADTNDDVGTDANVDAGPAPLTVTSYLAQLATLGCAKSVQCEGKLGAVGALETLCHPGLSARFLQDIGLDLPGATLDTAMAEQCLALLARPDCNFGGGDAASCTAALRGPRPVGAMCRIQRTGTECASGVCSGGGSCGVCAATLELGATCGGATDPPCAPNLACDATNHCVAGLTLGATCFGSGCGTDLVCSGTPTSTCTPLPNVGEPCNLEFLNVDPCRGVLVCSNGVCTAGGAPGDACGTSMPPCAPGSRCGPLNQCVALSLPGGTCVSRANCPLAHECVGGHCTPLPVEGEACSPTFPCVVGQCTGGTCQLAADGASCGSPVEPFWDMVRANFALDYECTGYCDGTTCAPRVADGGACMSDAACAPDSFCNGTCMACGP